MTNTKLLSHFVSRKYLIHVYVLNNRIFFTQMCGVNGGLLTTFLMKVAGEKISIFSTRGENIEIFSPVNVTSLAKLNFEKIGPASNPLHFLLQVHSATFR